MSPVQCQALHIVRKKFYNQSEYYGISNCVFNFNFLALVVSEILGGPKFTLGGLRTFDAPSGEIFVR